MNMSIHNVKEIKLNASKDLGQTSSFIRKLTIIDEKGNDFEINLFADNFNNLTIKSEI
tara:strand:- start:304 stop:477 length:174 start_codon:yes stop_codon:yes gene_type:complete